MHPYAIQKSSSHGLRLLCLPQSPAVLLRSPQRQKGWSTNTLLLPDAIPHASSKQGTTIKRKFLCPAVRGLKKCSKWLPLENLKQLEKEKIRSTSPKTYQNILYTAATYCGHLYQSVTICNLPTSFPICLSVIALRDPARIWDYLSAWLQAGPLHHPRQPARIFWYHETLSWDVLSSR